MAAWPGSGWIAQEGVGGQDGPGGVRGDQACDGVDPGAEQSRAGDHPEDQERWGGAGDGKVIPWELFMVY